MTNDNIIEMIPGIMQSEPITLPLDLSDPLIEAEILGECRRYSLSVFKRLSGIQTENDIASAINISATVGTILQSLQIGRMARDAGQRAQAISLALACQIAIEQAERG